MQVSFDFLSIVEVNPHTFVAPSSSQPRCRRMPTHMGGAVLLRTSTECGNCSPVFPTLQLLNIIYCLAQVVEFSAFVYLRIKLPNLPRCAVRLANRLNYCISTHCPRSRHVCCN